MYTLPIGSVSLPLKVATAHSKTSRDWSGQSFVVRLRLKCDDTRAETRFRLSAKRTSPFKSAGASVQSTTGSRGLRISGSNAGYTMFRGSVKSTGYPLHFLPPLPRASPCAITFQLESTICRRAFREQPTQIPVSWACLPEKQLAGSTSYSTDEQIPGTRSP